MKGVPGTCAKCNEPRYSTAGYCFVHYTEYRLAYAEKKRGGPSKQKRRQWHGCTYEPWFKSYESMNGEHGGACYDNLDIDPKWLKDPRAFGEWAEANGHAPGLTIERKDPRLGYWPDNCTWIPGPENSRRGYRTSPPVRGDGGRFIGRQLHQGEFEEE